MVLTEVSGERESERDRWVRERGKERGKERERKMQEGRKKNRNTERGGGERKVEG